MIEDITPTEMRCFLKENLEPERLSEFRIYDEMRRELHMNGFLSDRANEEVVSSIELAAFMEAKQAHEEKYYKVRIAEPRNRGGD